MPLQEIATKAAVSPQLALYYVRKLMKDGIIVSTHVAINYDALGMMHYHLAFQVNDSTALQKIISFFGQSNRSLFATTSIGCYDGSAEVLVASSAELRKFIDEMLGHFADIITRLDVMLIYKEYELRLYPL
jgi:DNA-binding Lrp family transcriptional regulator